MSAQHFRLLMYFTEISKAGSIRAAARKLSLSPAVLSEALSDLEDIAGVTLIHRTTRSMKLTGEGKRLLEKAQSVMDVFDDAFESLKSPDPAKVSGTLRLTMPTELASSWLPSVVSDFNQIFANIDTVIHADDMKIDLQKSQYEIAVRTQFSATQALGTDGVTAYPLELVCAPKFKKLITGDLVADLNNFPVIVSDHQIRNGGLFAMEVKNERQFTTPVKPAFQINNRQVALELVRQGFGAALLISISVENELKNSALIRVNETHRFGYVLARLVMRDRKPSRAAKAFRDFVRSKYLQSST